MEAPLSFKMTQWSCNNTIVVMLCYCIGESVCYWLEKENSMDTMTAKDSQHVTMKDDRTLLLDDCFIIYKKYNTFGDRESEQQHRTINFAELPNHPLLLTMVIFTGNLNVI